MIGKPIKGKKNHQMTLELTKTNPRNPMTLEIKNIEYWPFVKLEEVVMVLTGLDKKGAEKFINDNKSKISKLPMWISLLGNKDKRSHSIFMSHILCLIKMFSLEKKCLSGFLEDVIACPDLTDEFKEFYRKIKKEKEVGQILYEPNFVAGVEVGYVGSRLCTLQVKMVDSDFMVSFQSMMAIITNYDCRVTVETIRKVVEVELGPEVESMNIWTFRNVDGSGEFWMPITDVHKFWGIIKPNMTTQDYTLLNKFMEGVMDCDDLDENFRKHYGFSKK